MIPVKILFTLLQSTERENDRKREREEQGERFHRAPSPSPPRTIEWIRLGQKALWPSHERAINHAAAPEAGPAGGTASQNASGPACSIPSMHCSLSAVSPFTLAASFKFPADCYADHQIAKVWIWNEKKMWIKSRALRLWAFQCRVLFSFRVVCVSVCACVCGEGGGLLWCHSNVLCTLCLC